VRLNPVLLVILLLVAGSASAQTGCSAGESAFRVQLGPLSFTRTLALTNARVDYDVLNSPTNPQRDLTMTLTPRTEALVHLGRARFNGSVKEDLVYFQQFASERSVNTSYAGAVTLPLNRVTAIIGKSYLNTRDRPGFEIDVRSQHSEDGYNAQVELRALAKTWVGMAASRSTVQFERGTEFFGMDLQRELNRTMSIAGLSIRHQATPLTSLVVNIDREQDRFEYSSLRDSDSTKITGGVKFDPLGLISGSASFGYRKFDALSGTVPGYQGTMASADVSYRASGSTRLGVQGMRDLQYSYDISQPYYLQTGIQGWMQQQVGGPFDVIGRVGIQHLSYRGRLLTGVTLPDRIDVVHLFGGGIGYRVGRVMRVGLNLDQQHRVSDLPGHGYDGLRFGTSVSYGF